MLSLQINIRFGCRDFLLSCKHAYAERKNCCFEWYKADDSFKDDDLQLTGKIYDHCETSETEIHQLY